jgi:hypothetical protein
MHKVKHSKSGNDNFLCVDCGKDTFVDSRDYYMVDWEVWKKHGVGDKMLCMDCMETRLGHKLRKEEILDCPLNNFMNDYTSAILTQQ